MKKKKIKKIKKKAFSLIELLAVLVVLALLSLITVPIIINIISNFRESSYKNSIQIYGESLEKAVTEYLIKNPNKEYSNDINDYKDYFKFKGNDVLCEDFEINNNKIKLGCCKVKKSNYYNYNNGQLNEEKKGVCGNFSLYNTIKKQSLGTDVDNNINYSQNSSETNGNGVYEFSSTSSMVYPMYFYRGNIDNNNVIFNDYCWKIIRTTDTGGVKMIYNGKVSNGTCNNTGYDSTLNGRSSTKYNLYNNSLAYIGYMYGEPYKFSGTKITEGMVFGKSISYNNGEYSLNEIETVSKEDVVRSDKYNLMYTCLNNNSKCSTVYYVYNYTTTSTIYYMEMYDVDSLENAVLNTKNNKYNSNIKEKIDKWYVDNIKGKNENYLEDTSYCNDRSKYQNKETSIYTEFSSYKRITLHREPLSFDCDKNDKFTVSSKIGNGALDYPIATITADEMNLAGGIDNKNYYLYTGEAFFSMTPNIIYYTDVVNFADRGDNKASLIGSVSNSLNIRPVISIKNNILVIDGDGTKDNPYKLSEK